MVDNEPKSSEVEGNERFAERFRETWGRPEMTPVHAAAFLARLEARLKNGQRPFRLMPALVGVTMVAVLVSLVWIGRHQGRANDDGFLESLADAEAVASNIVIAADGTSQEVAYADSADGLWTVLDDETQDGLEGNLSNEYRALASWVFPTKATLEESSKQK